MLVYMVPLPGSFLQLPKFPLGFRFSCSCLFRFGDSANGFSFPLSFPKAALVTYLYHLSDLCSAFSKQKKGFPGGSVVKNPPANAGDLGSVPGSGRSPREGNGNPLQYSCLENPMDRESCQATVHGVTSWTRLGDQTTSRHKLLACMFSWGLGIRACVLQ